MSKNFNASILSTGRAIPSKLINNEYVSRKLKKKSQWIFEKTGISLRYFVNKTESASSLSTIAAKKAIKSSGILKDEINLIIACTFTSDYRFPGLSVKVHNNLKLKNAGAFDLKANCTGFQQGIDLACKTILHDLKIKYVLVIGCCVQSPYLNWNKPENCMFYGDGAGAAIIGRVPKGYGLISSSNLCISEAYENVRLRGGGSQFPFLYKKIKKKNISNFYYDMDGIETWKYAVTYMPKVIIDLLKNEKMTLKDIDFFVFHQANKNLLNYIFKKLNIPKEKFIINVNKYGNTGDASLAIALDEAVKKNKIKRNSKVIISGIGAGFIFGTSLINWY